MVISSIKCSILKRRRGTNITNNNNNYSNTNTNTYSPIKLKYRSARVRFDLNQQMWFVEAPAFKKKKVESNPAAANMSSTERVGRTVNTNNNKDRSRSNSLTSLQSNSSRNSKNTATSSKKISSSNNKMKAVDKQQPNLPDIDNSMDKGQDSRANEKSLSPLQSKSNRNNNSNNNSKARPKAPKTSPSMNKINALTFPKILAIHQSTNDK